MARGAKDGGKPQSYTGTVMLGVVLMLFVSPPDWTDERVVKGVQAFFMASVFAFNAMCYLLKRHIAQKNDQRVIRVPTVDGKGTESQSVAAYDLEAVNSLIMRGTLFYGLALFSGSYRKVYQLMLIQGLSQPLQVFDSQLSMIHWRGGDETSEALERPWKQAATFANFLKLYDDYERRQEAAKERAKRRANGMRSAKADKKSS